jgi:hypothetical protein
MPLVEKSQALYVVMVKKSTQVQFVFLHQNHVFCCASLA